VRGKAVGSFGQYNPAPRIAPAALGESGDQGMLCIAAVALGFSVSPMKSALGQRFLRFSIRVSWIARSPRLPPVYGVRRKTRGGDSAKMRPP
jgi:hypothetical protein